MGTRSTRTITQIESVHQTAAPLRDPARTYHRWLDCMCRVCWWETLDWQTTFIEFTFKHHIIGLSPSEWGDNMSNERMPARSQRRPEASHAASRSDGADCGA